MKGAAMANIVYVKRTPGGVVEGWASHKNLEYSEPLPADDPEVVAFNKMVSDASQVLTTP